MSKLKMLLLASVAAALLPAGADAATLFGYTGSVVTWVAPTTGTYRVTGFGAQGYSAAAGFSGGRGAEIAGTFSFTAGQMFQIAVGGAGQGPGQAPDQYNGGGGGGTFFVDALNNPFLVAGGGGGTRGDAGQNGTDASITEYGYTASGSSSVYTAMLKTTDLGLGGIVSESSWGSGGAGFYGDGQSDAPYGTGGLSFANGLGGGTTANFFGICAGVGGFGGGGAGAGCGGGGGGGGYSGGDGGWIAGGGGSFNLGGDAFALAGAGLGDGALSIESLDSGGVPEPASWALMIGGFAMVGGALRRRRAAAAA